jgi:hypothetical protein
MDIELAATHEAGHAVMQWFVGLELGALEMTVEGTNASQASTCCPRVPLATVQLEGREAVVICEAVVGQEFRITNPWLAWIAGEDQKQ